MSLPAYAGPEGAGEGGVAGVVGGALVVALKEAVDYFRKRDEKSGLQGSLDGIRRELREIDERLDALGDFRARTEERGMRRDAALQQISAAHDSMTAAMAKITTDVAVLAARGGGHSGQ